ncbi:MAG: beta-galactosidase trimerization domain-containing protein [Candidatus Omnitrophota bacterium]
MKRLFFICLFLISGITGMGIAQEKENYFTDEVKTPHVAWCKPYAKGKIKVIVLAGPNAVRRVMEIGQRIDLEIVGTINYDRPEATELLAGDWDICLLSDVNTKGLLPETRYKIIKGAAEGRGLVVINPGYAPTEGWDFSTKSLQEQGHNIDVPAFPPQGLPVLPEGKEFILNGFPSTGLKKVLDYAAAVKKLQPHYYINSWMDPWKSFRAYADSRKFAETGISTYKIGSGRGVNIAKVVETAEGVAFDFGRTITNYDYALSLVAKAILWAAPEKKRPDIVIQKIPDGLNLSIKEVPDKEFKITLLNQAKEPKPVKVRPVIRREDGITRDLKLIERTLLPAEPQELSFTLPSLGTGTYCLDIFVESKSGCETFGSGSFTVTSEKGIGSIELESDYVERGQTLTGKVLLRQAAVGDSVRIEFVDNYDRIVAYLESKVTDTGKPVPFTFQADPDITQLVRIRATLLEGNQEVDRKETRFSVPRRGKGKYNFIVWGGGGIRGILGSYACQQMKSAGVTAVLCDFYDGNYLPECAANDLMCVPYTTHLSGWTPKDAPERAPEKYDGYYGKPASWNKDTLRELEINWRVDAHMATRKHGVLGYSLGDEINTKYVDDSPECQQAYRTYLKRVYGTIENLNREWDEQFKSFEEINLLKTGDAWEESAFKQKKYPRWFDRQIFASENMMMVARQYRETFPKRLKDPEALCGFEGLGLSDHEYLDFDQIMASVDWWMPYRDEAGIYNNALRSLQPQGFLSGNWTSPQPASYWYTVMSGLNGIAYFMWQLEGWRPYEPHIGFLAPAYNFHPIVQKMLTNFEAIRNGLGDLFVNSAQENDPVALYYSIESALASTFDENRPFNTIQSAHKEFIDIIHGLGLEFKYVTGKQVSDGILDRSKYKLLILPCIQAISLKEAEALRKFVEEGGLLVADMRPGIYDEHGRSASPGMLDELFGVRRRKDGEPKSVPVKITGQIDNREIGVNFGGTIVDSGYEPVKAQVLGNAAGTPVFFVNQIGKGRAILLNFNLAAQVSLGSRYQLVKDLLTIAGVTPGLPVTDDNSEPLFNSCTLRWRTGEGKVLGIMLYPLLERNLEDGLSAVKVGLPSPAHIYDIGEGKYLGQANEVSLKLATLQPKFLAVLPYRVNELKIETSSPSLKQGEELKVRISLNGVPAQGNVLHPVHLEAIGPDGIIAAHFTRNVLVKGGREEIKFSIAFNEKTGKWNLRARDILTGKTNETSFEVKAE